MYLKRTTMIPGDSRDHLRVFVDKLEAKEPFGVIRCNDGEYLILKGTDFTNIDHWRFPGKGRLQQDLDDSIRSARDLPSLYIGIPCRGCAPEIYDHYLATYGPDVRDQWTYGNLFCNRNWEAFKNYLIEQKFPFYYVGPGTNTDHPLNVLERFAIDEFFIHHYDERIEELKGSLRDWVGTRSGVFMFSAGPVTKVLVPFLMKLFPHNTYIDAGSSIDLFMKGGSNRLYYYNGQPFTQVACDFHTGHHYHAEPPPLPMGTTNQPPTGNVTAVLTLFKRPHTLLHQLGAVIHQTVPPKEVYILKNFADGIELPEIPEELRSKVPIHIIQSTKNLGVWGRFALALMAETEYVCVFDDDTIPGRKWFENCLRSMCKREGLYGTIGLRCHGDYYAPYTRYGWDNPTTEITEVDIVGHAWFLKREWLGSMWSFAPDYSRMLRCGEDIALACFLQQKGIPTLVPPHPPGDLEMYGSDPHYAVKYGVDPVAISVIADIDFWGAFRYFADHHNFRVLAIR